jgi:hypothetical protein
MALLLQKQDSIGTDKDGSEHKTITAVASCSSSSDQGGTPVHSSSSGSPAGGKPSKVASLLKSLSGRALGRSNSKRDRGDAVFPEHTTLAVHADGGGGGSSSAADLDRMEAGRPVTHDTPTSDLQQLPAAAAAAGVTHQQSVSAPGQIARPGSPGPSGGLLSGAAGAVAGGLLRQSPGLGRPSAASVWKEAGWDAAVGVPVGIITLEDVLEELMQVST